MIEIGRLCIKIAGRDAGNKCIVIDVLDNNFVLIDGNVRRKKCNIKHLELLKEKLEIEKKASHEKVVEIFKKNGLEAWDKKSKEKKERPKKQRKGKKKLTEEKAEKKASKKKTVKKEIKKEEKKTENK